MTWSGASSGEHFLASNPPYASPPVWMVRNVQNPKYGGAVAGDWGPAIRAAIADLPVSGGVVGLPEGTFAISSADGSGNALTAAGTAGSPIWLMGVGIGATKIQISTAVTWGIQMQTTHSQVSQLSVEITTGGSCTYGVGISTPTNTGSAEGAIFTKVLVQKILSGTLTNAFAMNPSWPGVGTSDCALAQFFQCRAGAYTNAGYLIASSGASNNLDTHLWGCFASSSVGAYGVQAYENFTWIGGDVGQHASYDFRLEGIDGNVLIEGFRSENSKAFLFGAGIDTSQYTVSVRNVHWTGAQVVSTGVIINYALAVPLVIEGLTIANTGAVAPCIILGAGVDLAVTVLGLATSAAFQSLFSCSETSKISITLTGYTQLSSTGGDPSVAHIAGPVKLTGTKTNFSFNGTNRRVAGPTELITLSGAGAVSMVGDVEYIEVTLQANASSSTVSATNPGRRVTISWIQDGTGSRTYVWPARCKFAGGAAPAASTGVNLRDSVTFEDDGTNLRELSRAVGVAA